MRKTTTIALALGFISACASTSTQQAPKTSSSSVTQEIALESHTEKKTVAIRTKVSMAEIGPKMGELLGQVAAYLAEKGVKPAGPPFSIYHAHSPDNVDMEVGFPVSVDTPNHGEISAGILAGGKVATIVHVGPYEKLPETWTKLREWIAANNKTPAGAPWEVYLNDPQQTPPEQYQTKLFFPVTPDA